MTASVVPPPDHDPVPAFRLRDPRDVIGVIPGLIGFHPEDSVVLLCLGGPSRQVRLTMRADLPRRAAATAVRDLVARAVAAVALAGR